MMVRGETISKFGTVVSAIVASACCWLPLMLLGLGVSGAGIASTLEAWRPIFITLTFGFLASAFYFTYRPQTPASNKSCEADDCCAPGRSSRFNMRTLNKLMLWVVTLFAIAFLFFPSYVGSIFGTESSQVTSEMEQVVFNIEGMTCGGCSTTVAKAIQQVSGVIAVDVSYKNRQATVGAERGQTISVSEIKLQLKKAGYSARLKFTQAPLP